MIFNFLEIKLSKYHHYASKWVREDLNHSYQLEIY